MDKREIEFIHSNEAQGNHFRYNLKSPSTGKIGRNGYISKLNFLGSQNRSRKGNQNEAHYFFQLSLFFFACNLLANSQNPSLTMHVWSRPMNIRLLLQQFWERTREPIA